MSKFIILLFGLLCCLGCENNLGELDSVFKVLERNSPETLVEQFKTSELDSVLVNRKEYDKIFVDVLNDLMIDSLILNKVTFVFKNNGIQPVGKQVRWTFVAAFHKCLNDREYDIKSLFDYSIKLSNEINDEKYRHLESHE